MSLEHPYPVEALEFRFVLASGPGGQHVNKSSTAVELRVTLDALALGDAVLERLKRQQRGKLNKRGELIIQSDTFRSQLKNRKDALARLGQIIEEARRQPKKRVPTRPSRAAKRRRVDDKKQRARTKSARRKPRLDS